jgi:hypothetical protein
MAARRLIMILLVLLFVSSLAAALVPIDRSSDSSESSTATSTTAAETPRAGREIVKRIDARERKPETIRMRVGDQLQLTVDGSAPDQVEIPRLDLLEPLDLGAPARFDLLADEPGTYTIRLLEARRTIGKLVVRPPKQPASKDRKRRVSESGRRA